MVGNMPGQVLLQQGEDVNQTDGYSRPTSFWCEKWHTNPLLPSFQASIRRARLGDARRPLDRDGYTALHHAAFKGHVDIIQLLLQLNATVDAQTNDG